MKSGYDPVAGRSDDDGRDSWQVGFSHATGGLCCDICRCIVPKRPGDTAAHLEWHKALDGS